MMNDQVLASIRGGSAASTAWNAAKGFFRPTKFVVSADGPLQITKFGEVLTGARVVDRPKQIVRIAGTTGVAAGVVGGPIYAAKRGQGGEAQTRSIEQLTGLA